MTNTTKVSANTLHTQFVENIESQIRSGMRENPNYIDVLLGQSYPHNGKTKKAYNGTNALALMITSMLEKYTDNRWFTFKQFSEMGLRLKNDKKQKGTQIFYFIPHYDAKKRRSLSEEEYKKLTDEEAKHVFPTWKYYTVFNGDQIDGLEPIANPNAKAYDTSLIDRIANAISVIVKWGSTMPRPCYAPKEDKIYLPKKEQFRSEKAMLQTALHELSHATGNATRLNRKLDSKGNKHSYAFEELVAESSSALLCGYLGIEKKVDENHVAYLNSWLDAAENKAESFTEAFKLAEKAFNYIVEKADLANLEVAIETAKETVKKTRKTKAVKEEKTVEKKSGTNMYNVTELGITYLVVENLENGEIKASCKMPVSAWEAMKKRDRKQFEKAWGLA